MSGINVSTGIDQTVILRHVTVANQSNTNFTAALLEGDGPIIIESSIFAGNNSSNGDLAITSGALDVQFYNTIIESTNESLIGDNNFVGQALFLSPLDYFNGSVLKVHALENGMSIAIDLVDNMVGNSQCGTGVIVDQLGFTRPSGLTCDACAFEAASVPSEPPILDAIGEQNIGELNTLQFSVNASDADTSPENLTYVLMNQPSGATMTSAGLFSFTPTESQGPESYAFDVSVTDDGIPINMDSETIIVNVAEVNQNPILDAIGNQIITELQTLAFTATATDNDLPNQSLNYSLMNHPEGATITTNGEFTFTPTSLQSPGEYIIDVIVTDSGSGMLSDTETITISVEKDSDLLFYNGFE